MLLVVIGEKEFLRYYMTIDWRELLSIDQKVSVWMEYTTGGKSQEYQQHWAGLDHKGKPQAWRNGKTSWSGTSKKVWDGVKVA